MVLPGDVVQPSSVAGHRLVLAAERSGQPFVTFADDSGEQRVITLDDNVGRMVIGRRETCDVSLAWDDRVSRTHAELAFIGGEWTIEDDGLSRNGTFVNGNRLTSKRRLRDRDVISAGRTTITYRHARSGEEPTHAASQMEALPTMTEAQRRVLEALARPVVLQSGAQVPATNQEIAAELFLSVDAVKAHLRQLFRRFGLDDLPQIQKRTALVRVAVEAGLVRRSAD